MYRTVRWSDLALFYDFRKATRFCRSDINFPKNRQSFHIQKITGTLKTVSQTFSFLQTYSIPKFENRASVKLTFFLRLLGFHIFKISLLSV